jgi:Domain of unknown function (DUF4376)
MLLLYCLNGYVVGTHDDSQAHVDPSLYGDGTRIIPWSDELGSLVPEEPGSSPPRYLQPAETPAILKAYAAQVRFDVSVSGVPFTTSGGTSIPMQTARLDQSLVSSLAAHGQSLQATDAISFTQNNVAYAITAKDAIDMFHAMMAHVQSCRDIEADCIADLDSASPTILTYADVDARFAGVKAKTLRARS